MCTGLLGWARCGGEGGRGTDNRPVTKGEKGGKGKEGKKREGGELWGRSQGEPGPPAAFLCRPRPQPLPYRTRQKSFVLSRLKGLCRIPVPYTSSGVCWAFEQLIFHVT